MRCVRILLLLLVFIFLFGHKVEAQDFQTSLDSLYVASFDKPVAVTHVFTIKNLTAQKYPTKYTVYLGATRVKNLKVTSSLNKTLDYSLSQSQNQQILDVIFSTPTVGKDNESRFTLTYDDLDIATHEGSIASVTIPKLSRSAHIDTVTSALMVPLSFGPPQMVYPNQYQLTTDPAYSRIDFPQNSLLGSGITLMFGDKQIYEINLTYNLENPTITPIETQVTLPPDTQKQRVLIKALEPHPQEITQDLEGNWLATYTLQAKEQLTVSANLFVTVMRDQQTIPGYRDGRLNSFNEAQSYWEVENTAIKKLSTDLMLPAKMYEYVVENISYDYNQLEEPTIGRQGALKALTQTKQGLCLEYADALIALLRAQKIPALLHVGFAKTLNPTLQPVGLSSQSLHAWVEFYDVNTGQWRLTDPTWGHTTGGFDYFNQFDVNHITFVIQGENSQSPISPGLISNSIKASSFDVSVADALPQPDFQIKQSLSTPLLTLLGLSQTYNLSLTNESNTSLYNTPIHINPKQAKASDVDYLIPFSTKTIALSLDNIPSSKNPVTISLESSSVTYDEFKTHASTTLTTTAIAGTLASAAAGLAVGAWHLLVRGGTRRSALRR